MLRVLIVDDHDNFRQIIRMRLSLVPFLIVEEAATGSEALEKTDILLPDLIFMDIVLSDVDGLQITREIKTKHRGITIAIMTNHDRPEYREAASQSGAERFFPKASLDYHGGTNSHAGWSAKCLESTRPGGSNHFHYSGEAGLSKKPEPGTVCCAI